MVRCRAQYHIVTPRPKPDVVAIIDVGHELHLMTVTNDIDAVVARLIEIGVLRKDDRLIYRDSNGLWDEVLWSQSGFVDFSLMSCQSMELAIKEL